MEQAFDLYLTACGFDATDAETQDQQAALFLHIIGPATLEVYNTFTFTTDADCKKVTELKTKFKEYCIPRKNITYERYKFFKRDQRETENIDLYVTQLTTLWLPRASLKPCMMDYCGTGLYAEFSAIQ